MGTDSGMPIHLRRMQVGAITLPVFPGRPVMFIEKIRFHWMAEVVSLAPRIKSVPWSLATRFTEPVSLKSNSREISSKGERSRPAVVRCSFYGTGRVGPWSKSSRETVSNAV